ncbi:MAG: malate synthase A [Planctomycetes bacterium]|nr:malate synthase A [Planctomycetota bacterium]
MSAKTLETKNIEDLNSEGIEFRAPVEDTVAEILTSDALRFVAGLQREFNARRKQLLDERKQRAAQLDAGGMLDFLSQTAAIRDGQWRVAPLPDDLEDRRVEITGPVERKMVINALNSGANCFMADLEDSHSPTWSGTLQGQINLRDAVNGTISYVHPQTQKHYELNSQVATLIVRPRGWHLEERHVLVDGQPISASLWDFGLYLFHNAGRLLGQGTGPYFYLPKLESHLEARLWNDVFIKAQDDLRIPQGTIRATVLIETILAAFEMDEILFELRDHIAGLNCGRWDYIFSFIKRFQSRSEMVLPDRAQVTMTTHFMRSYSLLAIKTCHKRGASAIGGMAAQIPIRDDQVANQKAMTKVTADKHREAHDGHDGTWVAHPGLVELARREFDKVMKTPNQIDRLRDDVQVSAEDLLRVPKGTITEKGLRLNIRVGVQYMEAWLRGNGCVPLDNLMEDAATAEISRTQVWQWLHNAKTLDDGRVIDTALFDQVFNEEIDHIANEVGPQRFDQGKFELATKLFREIIEQDHLEEFLTLKAYSYLN